MTRGTNVARLLHYLYGPGRFNEHTDPHLVAGFGDPTELEPDLRHSGSRDLRRLTGLLTQPLAALDGANYAKPVLHCSVRAAPQDQMLSDDEWARIATQIMHRTGLAPEGDDLGVRWVAVRHAPDHIHLVATLARQDRIRPKLWNDFLQLRQACQEAERWFDLRSTAPADRTAPRRPTRAETEQSTRRAWSEPPRVKLRREVCTAVAGALTEQEFLTRLDQAGVLIRRRYSTIHPGEITGYAVGLPDHATKDGQPIWYSGGKLAADLTLPKLRSRWRDPESHDPLAGASTMPEHAIRGVLRATATTAAAQATGEQDFFARLRAAGLLVRYRYSELHPGQLTGYSVALPGCTAPDGTPRWYGGGRLHAGLTLPRLRNTWTRYHGAADQPGTPRFTAAEKDAIYTHAARQAASAAEHIRHCRAEDPPEGADAARATADVLYTAAKAFRNPMLRCATDTYDRAARSAHGRAPRRTEAGDQLRTIARLLAMTDPAGNDLTTQVIQLITSLMALAAEIAALREAETHPWQAEAARQAAQELNDGLAEARDQAAHHARPSSRSTHHTTPAGTAQPDFPFPVTEAFKNAPPHPDTARPRPHPPRPPTRMRTAR
ncbi:MAG TPA: hypothetical protein VGH27_06765 [Streptosporangiaceae bacterium]